jgi:hypothetical protein
MSEQERQAWERQRGDEIKAENLDARRRAADPAQRDEIDRSTGRTWGDAVGRGMYADSRLQDFQATMGRFRQERQEHRLAQVRDAGRAGRN